MFSMFRHPPVPKLEEEAPVREAELPNPTPADAQHEPARQPDLPALPELPPRESSSDEVLALLEEPEGGWPNEEPEHTAVEEVEEWSDATGEAASESDLEQGPRLSGPARGRRGPSRRRRALAKPAAESTSRPPLTGEQRLLLLDTWRRSGLPAGDFAALVGISKHTLYKWNQQFEQFGPAGLADQPRMVRRGSQLPEATKRSILMLKQAHPEWGCQRISDMLLRGPALPASASTVARVLHEAGYEREDVPTRSHPDKVRRFERARPNQLWQTDLFTFVLKRQNRRVHMVAFLDDHSRFVVSCGVHATASTALVLEAVEAAIASYGPPEEILTDNGPQYVTWRGTSQFTKHLQKRGVRQIVARPRRPQTLGKIERFWGTLWREFLEGAVFVDLSEARLRIGHFIDYYNFQRVHRGLDGLVPADRFFGAAQEVLQTLKQRVAANALELARHGQPKAPFYVTGRVEGQSFSVHAEGERLILRRANEPRQEIALTNPDTAAAPRSTELPSPLCPQAVPPSGAGEPADRPPPAPGTSPLDAFLAPPASGTSSAPDEENLAEPQGGAS